jgi:hypothetical protein
MRDRHGRPVGNRHRDDQGDTSRDRTFHECGDGGRN